MKPLYDPTAARRLRIRPPRWSPYRYTRWRWHVLFAAIDAIGWLLWGPWKIAAAWIRRSPTAEQSRDRDDGAVRAILVIQLDHLGDAVMSLGLLRALRRHYTAARIHVLVAAWNDELLATCGCVHRVHVMETPRFARGGGWGWMAEVIRWGRMLRRRRFDLAIDVRGEFPHAALMWLARVRRRVGWTCGGGGFLLTDRVPYVPGRHEVQSRSAILAVLGLETEDETTEVNDWLAPVMEPTASSLRWGDEQLAAAWPSASPGDARPLVALHVGAGTSAKRWPVEAWRELADRLTDERRARIVIVGLRQTARRPRSRPTLARAGAHSRASTWRDRFRSRS